MLQGFNTVFVFKVARRVSEFCSFIAENIIFYRRTKSSENVVKVRVFPHLNSFLGGLQLPLAGNFAGLDRPTRKEPFSANKLQILPIFAETIPLNKRENTNRTKRYQCVNFEI